MSRYWIVLCAAFLIVSVIGCEKSKLQQEVMDDSTWESSAGAEDISVEERKPEGDDKWEEKNAPMEGEKPESSLGYPRVTKGVIARSDLVAVLDRGLGRYLQNVETEPAFHQGAFVGFRIVSLFPGEPAYASLDLRPGDIVTRVNGRPIERPEQAVVVWEALRTAEDLVVHYRRGNQQHALHFRIVDAG
jgi:type II secretory pathway component PulC